MMLHHFEFTTISIPPVVYAHLMNKL